MKKFLIVFLLLQTPLYAKNVAGVDYYTLRYVVKSTDEFHSILAKFLRPELPVRAWSAMVQETKARNPHVKSWESLRSKTIIFLFLDPEHIAWEELPESVESNLHPFPPRPTLDGEYKEYNPDVQDFPFPLKYDKSQDKIELTAEQKKQLDTFSWGAFFSFSDGTFDEITKNLRSKSVTKQNSPITIGTNFSFKFKNKSNINGSAYYSYMNDVIDSITKETFAIPAEYGMTLYYESSLFKRFLPYFGLDYESFSVFSAQQFQNDGSRLIKRLDLAFFTIGLSKPFKVGKRPFFLKTSYSKTFINQGSDNTENYNGEKLIAFLATPISESFSLTGFYKKHFLRGDSILNIYRFGLGLGYKF